MPQPFDPSVDEEESDAPLTAINTTPLVDVMLVLLIIFLITIPVVTHVVPVNLPKEISKPASISLDTVTISVDGQNDFYWNKEKITDPRDLLVRLKELALTGPQASLQIRGDQESHYESIATILRVCGEAGIGKISFITEPPHHD